jgi:hypothetical protein
MLIELALSGKFIYDLVKRLIHDKVFRTLGFLVFVLVLIGTMFFWLADGMTFLDAMHYSVGTLSLNSPSAGPASSFGKVFDMLYRVIGVGVFLTFILEAGKTIITAHHDFEAKQAERKATKKAKKEAAAQQK